MNSQQNQGSGNLKVVVDRLACCGYGVCAQICPEVYKLDAGGMIVIENDIVPPELAEKAREGADACPQLCIKLEPI